MAYRRQISYIDLIENELKRGNAGFVKWEKYDECQILSVFVSGLTGIHLKEVTVYLENKYPIGKLNIRNGRAEGTYLLTQGEKEWKEDIGMIRIPIGDKKELIAKFESVESISPMADNQEADGEATQPDVKEQEDVETTRQIDSKESDELIGQADSSEQNHQETPVDPVEKTLEEQLQETHELIYPFGNDIGCYRIFPKDINLLRVDYHQLLNNQFLMHGYYNYRHLIICKKENSEKEFWLGVPGIYHKREKMAARMFGFEKFEGTKPDYHVGDLGYYLITVE